ncbi:uncharacterized protein JN550_002596 [Neoarthrinium moseri]|uniref:uncharacterized protein n=1 Tax=Neoarthrinium moseri TaxID=1658444 RepID=UPI001FDD057E|nr:uncharacterized protein JN550_002596 [Neoarthrinium moseri]KAI1874017.1 hypothetical protein JN550_002596 [Neoarthrinium moseri]
MGNTSHNDVTWFNNHAHRNRGLTVTTNLHVEKNLSSKPNKKESLEDSVAILVKEIDVPHTKEPQKREISEALLNDDWRQKWRPEASETTQGTNAFHPPFNRPDKAGSKVAKRKLYIDTAMAAAGNHPQVRQYRGTKDSPLDPEWVLSAPATKKEYSFTKDEQHSSSDIDPSSAKTDCYSYSVALGRPHRVSLHLTSPIAHKINDHVPSPILSSMDGSWSKLTAISESTASSRSGDSWDDVEFPLGQLQAVKSCNGFRVLPWSRVDHLIKQALTKLSPSSHRCKQTQAERVEGSRQPNECAIGQPTTAGKTEEDMRKHQAIIEKLNRKTYPDRPSLLHPDLAPVSEGQVSNHSGFSDASRDGLQKATTLNPQASEFLYLGKQETLPATVDHKCLLPPAGRPTVTSFSSEDTEIFPKFPNETDQSFAALDASLQAEKYRLLEARVQRMQAENVQLVRQLIDMNASQMRFISSTPMTAPITSMLGQMLPPPNNGTALSIPFSGGPVFSSLSLGTVSQAQPLAAQVLSVSEPRTAPSTSSMPSYNGHTAGLPTVRPTSGPPPANPLPLPVVLPPNTMGPKPVTKPKGPPRPHDPEWNKRQLEYEAYLEHQRTVDPNYHIKCKERQSKRADRQRRETLRSEFKIPGPSAPIEIKVPAAGEKTKENQNA